MFTILNQSGSVYVSGSKTCLDLFQIKEDTADQVDKKVETKVEDAEPKEKPAKNDDEKVTFW